MQDIGIRTADVARIILGGLALTFLPGAAQAGAAQAGTAPLPLPVLTDIYKPGDGDLDCHGLSREIFHMEDVIFQYDQAQRSAENTGTGISIAKALGGFLIGSVPGALGVMAAGHVASEAVESRAEDAEEQEHLAAQRRSLMIGMFNAKQCEGPVFSLQPAREAAAEKAQEALYQLEPAAGDGSFVARRNYSGSAMNVRYND